MCEKSEAAFKTTIHYSTISQGHRERLKIIAKEFVLVPRREYESMVKSMTGME